MRQFVESLKRLYLAHKIDVAQVCAMCDKKTITEEEKKYILQTD